MSPDEGKLSRGKKLVFVALIVALLWGAGELAWHLYASQRLAAYLAEKETRNDFFLPDPATRIKLRPGDWAHRNTGTDDTCYFHINRFSLRGPEIAEEKPADSLRILCLGGSTTFGTSCLRDSLTYPAQLEAGLRARGLPVQVLNGGVPRFTTVDSLGNLRRLGALAPDLVIVYHALNDVCFAAEVGEFYYAPDSAPRRASRELRYTLDSESSLLEALWRRLGRPDKARIAEDRQSIEPRTIDGFRANLGRIVEEASGLGAGTLLLTFASQLTDAEERERRRATIESDLLFQECRLPLDTLALELSRFNQALRDFGAERALPVVDLEGGIPADDAFWGDPFHLNAAGSSRKVELLIDAVEAALRERQG